MITFLQISSLYHVLSLSSLCNRVCTFAVFLLETGAHSCQDSISSTIHQLAFSSLSCQSLVMICVNYKTYLIYSLLWQLEDWARFTVKLWKDPMSWVFVIHNSFRIIQSVCISYFSVHNYFVFLIYIFSWFFLGTLS